MGAADAVKAQPKRLFRLEALSAVRLKESLTIRIPAGHRACRGFHFEAAARFHFFLCFLQAQQDWNLSGPDCRNRGASSFIKR
jgi:hypothetical protein